MWRFENILKSIFIPQEKNNYLPPALSQGPLFWYSAGILILKIAVIFLVLTLSSTDFFSAINSQRLITLINGARQEKKLPPLILNSKLATAAELKTDDMLTKDYFEHTSPAGITPWHWFKIAGYNFEYAGENLAMDFFESDAVLRAWMNSPTHRDNILNPNYREIGIAVKEGEIEQHRTTLAVLTFGTQQIQKLLTAQTPPKAQTIKQSGVTPKTQPSAPTEKNINSGTPAPPTAPSTPVFKISPAISPFPPLQPQIALKTIAGASETSPLPSVALIDTSRIERAPRVLGALTSRLDEIAKSLYLYFTLFLIAALAINILVKIRIQRWATIFTTSSLIALSTLLIFV